MFIERIRATKAKIRAITTKSQPTKATLKYLKKNWHLHVLRSEPKYYYNGDHDYDDDNNSRFLQLNYILKILS